ncbi:MAG: hypothetical protein WBP43_05105 [Chitinophagales bacterium]
MTPSNDLFELIKSMSRKEKIHFTLHTKHTGGAKAKNYLTLFNAISRQNIYDELAIKTAMGKSKKGESFSVMKNYLHNLVLDHITNYHYENHRGYRVKEYFRKAQMLYDKNLLNQSLKYVQKAKKIASSEHRYIDLISILQLEENISKIHYSIQQYETTFKQNFEYELNTINQYYNTRQYIYLDCQLLNAIRNTDNFTDGKSNKPILSILNHPLLSNEHNAISLYSGIYFNTINGIGYHILDEEEKSYVYRKNLVELMEGNTLETSPYIGNYIVALTNLTSTEFNLHKYADGLSSINKIKTTLKKYDHLLVERIKTLATTSIILNMTTYFGYFGKSGDIELHLQEVEKTISIQSKKMDPRFVVHILYSLAYLAFKIENYDKAFQFLQQLINFPTGQIDKYIQRGYRLLLLMVHLEMRNFRLLQYMAINTYRYLLKSGELTRYDKIIINFLKHKTIDKAALYKLHTSLLEIKSNKFEAKEFTHLDVISWVESKIEKLPFLEVYRKNNMIS